MSAHIYILTRDLTPEECPWRPRNPYKKGKIAFKYRGDTCGCIGKNGAAFTEKENELPFFELPLDAIKEIYVNSKMKSDITFEELAKLGEWQQSKRPPITYKKALAQVRWLKKVSSSKDKKHKH